jgi:hypothetical protein
MSGFDYLEDYVQYRIQKEKEGITDVLGYEDFADACAEEDDQSAREWDDHLQRMRAPMRYV